MNGLIGSLYSLWGKKQRWLAEELDSAQEHVEA